MKGRKPSRRYVDVRLTPGEATALAYAVGNSLYSDEDARSLFVDGHSRDAAYRAQMKLAEAIASHAHAVAEHVVKPTLRGLDALHAAKKGAGLR